MRMKLGDLPRDFANMRTDANAPQGKWMKLGDLPLDYTHRLTLAREKNNEHPHAGDETEGG